MRMGNEDLEQAVRMVACHPGRVKERLEIASIRLMNIIESLVPEPCWIELTKILAEMNLGSQSQSSMSIKDTLADMTDDEASNLAERLFDLYNKVHNLGHDP